MAVITQSNSEYLVPLSSKRDQLALKSYWDMIPLNFKMESMYECFKRRGGGVLERNHPTKESHAIWSDYLYKLYKEYENEDEF